MKTKSWTSVSPFGGELLHCIVLSVANGWPNLATKLAVNLQDFTPKKKGTIKEEGKERFKKSVMVLYLARQELSWLIFELRQNLVNLHVQEQK
jgi:hypothetical protein